MTPNEEPSGGNGDKLQVDQQEGGPGPHSEDGSRGSSNDVASGGSSSEEEGETTAVGAHDGAGDVSDDAEAAGG